MELSLAQAIEAAGAHGVDPESVPLNARVTGWSIDSRTINPGDLFFAIKGESHDGHAFVRDVLARGAVAAVVSESFAGACEPLLRVADTLLALQHVASFARKQWKQTIVAVTGSAGKTTTKDIIADFLGVRFRVGKTIGNFNNHIGLPLSLLRIPDDAELAVLEMGMNHAGEIRNLASIAEPQTGVVTNVGYAHVEAFESIEGVAAAKRELIEMLPSSGTAVLNADDSRVASFRHWHSGRTITYGAAETADVRVTNITATPNETTFQVSGVIFKTTLAGRHNISNILAGLAAANVFGLSLSDLVGPVARLRPGKMRGERIVRGGMTILNDSYNSNPEAACRMIDVLCEEPAQRRIAVLGEMLELGHMAENLHRKVGAYAAQAGIDILVGVGGASRSMVEEGKRAGLSGQAVFFENPESAGAFLRESVKAGDAILFKGSRGAHVEKVLATMEG